MGMISEELTYQMAREQVNQWRQQLKRTQERRNELEAAGDLSFATFTAGVAEGLATAIREMDRILDASPICKQWAEAAR